ncbi:MAG: copper chaperone PCu(A)C [Sphingomonas bacterium]|nr:copper chaperone PCu(A)C [Sphingomonas bacterium]
MNFAPLLIAFALTASCAPGAPQIEIGDAWARATAPGQSRGAAYATIVNRGAADRLVGVASDAGSATLHRSHHDGGVARMRMLPELPIPAGSSVALAPGGTHVMLTRLAAPLAIGADFPLTFRFAGAGPRTVKVTVVAAGAR